MNDRHSIARQIEDAAEAQASRIDDLIRSNEAVKQSIKSAVVDLANIIGSELDERNKALALLASAIRSGTTMLPAAPQLTIVNADDMARDMEAAERAIEEAA